MGDKRMQGKKRGGWPKRTPEPGERVSMSFRVTPEFKAKLDRAAKKSGRSLAQEIELRLEQTFHEERHLVDALEMVFGRQEGGLMLAIGNLMKEVRLPYPPFENPEAFDSTIEAVNLLLETIAPNGKPAVWARLQEAFEGEDDANYAELCAAMVLGAIADPAQEEVAELGPLIPVIRDWLGEDLIARLRQRLDLPYADRKKIER
jgi:predicted transcriptional regulator